MRVAQVAHLHRRGAQRKHRQAVRGGVAGQVHQHVEAVVHDQPVQRQVVQVRRLAPVVGAGAGHAGVLVDHGAGLVDEHLQLRMVVALQHRQHEHIDRVLAVQVARHIAHAQPPHAAVATRPGQRRGPGHADRDRRQRLLGHATGDAPVQVGHRIGAQVRLVQALHQQPGGALGVAGQALGLEAGQIAFKLRPAVAGGLQVLAPAQGHRVVRLQGQHPLHTGPGPIDLPELGLQFGQRQPGLCIIGRELRDLLAHRQRLGAKVVDEQLVGQQRQQLRVARLAGLGKRVAGRVLLAQLHLRLRLQQPRAVALRRLAQHRRQRRQRP